MATKTKDMALLRKEKRGTSSSTTKSKLKQPNQVASPKNNIPNKQNLNQGKKLPSLHDPNVHNKQALNQRQSFDNKPPSLSGHAANTLSKIPSLSNGAHVIHNKPNVDRRKSIDFRPTMPSTTLCNSPVKKLASSSSDSNIQNKQMLARRSSLDYRAALTSGLDITQGKKLTSSSSDPNILNKQTIARPLDQKPSLSSPLPKARTSPNPKERNLKPALSLPSKPSSPKSPMNKLSKIPHATKDVVGKKHSPGLYARAVKPESPTALTSKPFVISDLADIVDIVSPKAEELEQVVEHHEPVDKTFDEIVDIVSPKAEAGESSLVMEADYEGLNETVNIDEYLKAAESSLYVVENQEVIKMEVPEEQELVEETTISNHIELEEINHEPSKPDLEEIEEKQEKEIEKQEKEIEKQEIEIEKQEIEIKPINEDHQEEAKVEESETIVKALDDCQHQQEKKESEEMQETKEIEEKVMDVNIQQEKKEEIEGKEKGKESKEIQESLPKKEIQENKSTMAFARPYTHLVHKKESVVSNDVIEETASKLREQRKNRVKALAGAFETVISLQDPRA